MPRDTNRPTPDHPPESSEAVTCSFAEFLRRVRAGDAHAAAELVRRYESAVLLEVRLRLRNLRLRRVVDSLDICQSVFASFFLRAAAGQYDLGQPSQLVRLLVVIARKKVAYQARRERAQCRDNRRLESVDLDSLEAAASPTPNQLVAAAELFREFRRRLTAEEQRLAALRAQGRSWAKVAAELGGTPQGRRMQWSRAGERVARQLGLEEISYA
jgi:RNA polymerase sigma-70 factor (ECF subfamily)